MKRFLCTTVAAIALAGCASTNEAGTEGGVVPQTAVTAALNGADGTTMGTATATQAGDDILVRVEATNLPSGAHGIHIHQTGTCTAPDFASAGPHWNPTGAQHGKDNPAGMHRGDLPNVLIGTDGRGTLEYRIANAKVSGGGDALLDNDGAALVVHAAADDYRTDPSGNSGARIACGVFR